MLDGLVCLSTRWTKLKNNEIEKITLNLNCAVVYTNAHNLTQYKHASVRPRTHAFSWVWNDNAQQGREFVFAFNDWQCSGWAREAELQVRWWTWCGCMYAVCVCPISRTSATPQLRRERIESIYYVTEYCVVDCCIDGDAIDDGNKDNRDNGRHISAWRTQIKSMEIIECEWGYENKLFSTRKMCVKQRKSISKMD